eukprot:m.98055 g.98055  ORF g.98055 m.98055 type:complete len:71 (+) comp13622_c0_seq3:355-567(+)
MTLLLNIGKANLENPLSSKISTVCSPALGQRRECCNPGVRMRCGAGAGSKLEAEFNEPASSFRNVLRATL